MKPQFLTHRRHIGERLREMTHMGIKRYSGWDSVPQIHAHPELQNGTLFGNWVFADVVNDKDQKILG